MALPCGATGSLNPTVVPARPVCLTVKHPHTCTLCVRFTTVVRVPLGAPVSLSAATAPAKLPTLQCPPLVAELESSNCTAGIPRAAPRTLRRPLQCLPP